MKKKTFSFEYTLFERSDQLSNADQELLNMARKIATESYSPYSRYHVGAALRLEDGLVVEGSNQENVAFPSGLCAERVAAFYASANYPGIPFDTIAITAFAEDFDADQPVTPCGACRQVLSEYEHKFNRPIRVIMQGASANILLVESVQSLLPFTFYESKLKKL